jgi:uncharacterized protein Yka (UPF0111/DUF47 family)
MTLTDNFPVSAWLAGIDPRIDSSPRAVLRPIRFFDQLETQAKVSVASSRTLQELMKSANGHRAEHLSVLAKCRETARTMDEELLQALRMTVITPLDCEDLKRISARMYRIVDAFVGAGHAVRAASAAEERLIAVQERIVSGAEAMAAAVADLAAGRGIEDSSRDLWERTREASILLRDTHVDVLNSASDPLMAMLQQAVSYRLCAVLDLFRQVNRLIAKAKLKAG